MIVHWAGRGSNLMIALAKDQARYNATGTSKVYFSYDYGKTFTEKQTSYMTIYGNQAVINMFYSSKYYTNRVSGV